MHAQQASTAKRKCCSQLVASSLLRHEPCVAAVHKQVAPRTEVKSHALTVLSADALSRRVLYAGTLGRQVSAHRFCVIAVMITKHGCTSLLVHSLGKPQQRQAVVLEAVCTQSTDRRYFSLRLRLQGTAGAHPDRGGGASQRRLDQRSHRACCLLRQAPSSVATPAVHLAPHRVAPGLPALVEGFTVQGHASVSTERLQSMQDLDSPTFVQCIGAKHATARMRSLKRAVAGTQVVALAHPS